MRLVTGLLLVVCATCAGCAAAPAVLTENPVYVPSADYETVWNHTVDVVNDYFVIDRESRVDGRIETRPQVGSTLLEPWRGDSAGFDQRLEATIQSIRRRATVRVTPAGGGFLVAIEVFKELEDLPRPQFADAGAATFRHDNGFNRATDVITRLEEPQGWIIVGRDFALENQILTRVRQSLMGAVP